MNILRMIPPDDFPSTSSLDGKVRITGNVKLALEIKKSAKKIIANGKNLYLAQEEIKNVLIKDYGAEWFEKMVKPLTSSLKMNTQDMKEN